MFRVRIKIIFCILAAGLVTLPFQNCSQPAEFESPASSTSTLPSNSTSPGLQLGGGEGYGGKVYELVSPTDPCASPGLRTAEIQTDANSAGFLTAKDCRTLAQPEPVNYARTLFGPAVIAYNGQTFRDITQPGAPFQAPMSVLIQHEAENFERLQTSGGGLTGDGFWRITDDDYIAHRFTLPAAGVYRLAVRAKGESAPDGDARMRIQIGSTVITEVEVREIAADYSVEVNLPAGTHRVILEFTNDTYDAGPPRIDRNLEIDRIVISR
jgi:hypothetical protein